MKCFVAVTFVPGQQGAIAALMPAEQAHVRELMERGAIEAIHVAADRSRIWLVVPGDSPDQVRQTMAGLPLYPYMQLEVTPLLELAPPR
jgi:muconolactone delta-isomerase